MLEKMLEPLCGPCSMLSLAEFDSMLTGACLACSVKHDVIMRMKEMRKEEALRQPCEEAFVNIVKFTGGASC